MNALAWLKSSRSVGNGNCVEVAPTAEAVAVRDSKLPTEGDFPHLLLDTDTWTGLITAIKSGEVALTAPNQRIRKGRPSGGPFLLCSGDHAFEGGLGFGEDLCTRAGP
jgi:hypothetical protein